MESSSEDKGKDQEKEKNGLILKFLLYAVLIVAVAVSVLYFIKMATKTSGKSTLKIQHDGSSVEIKVDNNNVELAEIVRILFDDKASRVQTIALLREYEKLYELDDPQLVKQIETIDEKEFISEKLRELLNMLKGPFKRELHSFYNVEDAEAMKEAIVRLNPDDSVAKMLKDLLLHRKGPFVEVGANVEVSVPAGDNIREGFAAACRSNYFYRKSINLFNKAHTRMVHVYVKNAIGCAGYEEQLSNLIQISYEDMIDLLGEGPIRKKEFAYAVVPVIAN